MERLERTKDLVRGLRTAAGFNRAQADGFVRRMIAEEVIRPTGKRGKSGPTSGFAFPPGAVEATAVIAFLHGLGLRDCDGLTRTWEGLLTAPEGEASPIAKILAELEADDSSDLPAFQISEHRAVDDPSDAIISTRVFYRGATSLAPPQREGYAVSWHVNLRLCVILAPLLSPAETAH